MDPIRILTVCGSLQRRSSNLALLQALPRLAGPEVRVLPFGGLRELPHFDLDLNEGEPPAPVRAWRGALQDADGVFIATPEYGHSLPGALKNAIDWVFGSGELHRKPVVITAASAGPGRGRRGLAALAQTLLALEATVLGGEPVARGPELDAACTQLLEQLVAAGRRARAGEAAVGDVRLPSAAEGLVRGTSLLAPLRARVAAHAAGASGRGTSQGFADLPVAAGPDLWLTQLAALLVDTLGGAPLGGPELVLARVEGLLAGEHAELGRALLDDLVGRVDATPLLSTVLDALGPRALAHLG
jgi:NAD(P)H-dependent FMN reductase